MQYKTRYALKTREGEERTARKFLLMPRSFGKGATGRWLCYADVVERVSRVDKTPGMDTGAYEAWQWCEVGFADEWETSPPKTLKELAYENSNLQNALAGLAEMTSTLVETTRKRGRLILYANNEKFEALADEVQNAHDILSDYAEDRQ